MNINKDNKIGEVQITIPVTEPNIEDIMVGALEGGINYWGRLTGYSKCRDNDLVTGNPTGTLALENLLGNVNPVRADKPDGEPVSTWCAYLLLQGKVIWIQDIEDPEEVWGLTLQKLLNGISQFGANRYFEFDQLDADDYDSIIQYSLFGKLVYG